jgi:hypothetical protein
MGRRRADIAVLANKLARIAWSVLANQKAFDTNKDKVAAI